MKLSSVATMGVAFVRFKKSHAHTSLANTQRRQIVANKFGYLDEVYEYASHISPHTTLILYVLLPLITLGLFLQWLLRPILVANNVRERYIETTFYDPSSNRNKTFPTVYDRASKYMSIIVPAYNEEARISYMLDEALRYLVARSEASSKFTWEIIVVDDGSVDKTICVVRDYVMRYGTDRIRLLRLTRNLGKGGAVRKGMMCSRGQYLLMADADGATRFQDLEQLEIVMGKLCRSNSEKYGIAVGSRVQIGDETKAERTFFRQILQYGFHLAVSTLCVRGVQDTQCGFKMFSRASARRLFPTQRIFRWAFDVELLFLAQRMMNMPIEEVPVNWVEIDGSKVNIVADSISMLRDMFIIRVFYGCKIWQINRGMRQ